MTTHDATAARIAARYGTYHRREGVDILTATFAIEVESYSTVTQAESQLDVHRFTHRLYCAGADKSATDKALAYYRNSTIGVMDSGGNILKASSN